MGSRYVLYLICSPNRESVWPETSTIPTNIESCQTPSPLHLHLSIQVFYYWHFGDISQFCLHNGTYTLPIYLHVLHTSPAPLYWAISLSLRLYSTAPNINFTCHYLNIMLVLGDSLTTSEN